MIKIDFEMTDGTYTLRDAITLPDNHTLTQEEIEQIKQSRWQDWIKMVTSPPVVPEYELDEFGNIVLDSNGIPVVKESTNG